MEKEISQHAEPERLLAKIGVVRRSSDAQYGLPNPLALRQMKSEANVRPKDLVLVERHGSALAGQEDAFIVAILKCCQLSFVTRFGLRTH